MNIKSYDEAVALGPLIAEAWLRTMGEVKPVPMEERAKSLKVIHHNLPSHAKIVPDDGMNKLERAFWCKLQEAKKAGVFADVWREPFKLRVIGNRWYIPDFATRSTGLAFCSTGLTFWETKGFMREDAALKLVAAAEKYQCFRWILVRRDIHTWRCCLVTSRGISRDEFTPDWLR